MCAKICLNGDGQGKGTHLLLYCTILRGELVDHLKYQQFMNKKQEKLTFNNNTSESW